MNAARMQIRSHAPMRTRASLIAQHFPTTKKRPLFSLSRNFLIKINVMSAGADWLFMPNNHYLHVRLLMREETQMWLPSIEAKA